MTVREIRLYGDPVLRTVCAPIEEIDEGVRALIADLLDTVAVPGRAGVAANQIGVAQRAFSYNIDGDIGYVINPVLTEVRGEPVPTGEGCLSVPGLWHDTPRHPWARVEGIDLDGNPVVLEGEGLLAQALQHETDHLDGTVYLSRLQGETRRLAMRQVRESDWF
ncbi:MULTISPECIES: peptide deformylase [Microbacterium]|uniref:peptide deformylase n=1 Tax=Microbacterium TaxID=33882 RepID=UPI00217DC934|nr:MULTISPECIES: peptide deformylase [Microbacterium]UWF76789.1 peptide deformylase [Microbacterium neungamense]WCM54939.1 peptide deformylase [Microbacterium sp. EF45047]